VRSRQRETDSHRRTARPELHQLRCWRRYGECCHVSILLRYVPAALEDGVKGAGSQIGGDGVILKDGECLRLLWQENSAVACRCLAGEVVEQVGVGQLQCCGGLAINPYATPASDPEPQAAKYVDDLFHLRSSLSGSCPHESPSRLC